MLKRAPVFCLLAAALVLAACQGQSPRLPDRAVASTPVESLLVSRSQQVEQALPTPVPDSIIAEADAEYLLLTNLYERSAPSVVNVEVIISASASATFREYSNGSGFIYDYNGHIVTNAHVVADARTVRVTFNDGYVADAEIVGYDVFSDLAVIRVNVAIERLNPLELADSDLLRVGQRAIAIGNPFGLSSSMTVGIISGLGRQLPSAELIDNTISRGFQNPQIIQVDAEINPGNSGGPLLNSRGQVIGVNTAIRTTSGIFEGVGFAVPANTARRVIPELIANGRVSYSWIGIASDVDLAAIAEPLNLPVNAGVMIFSVTRGSPAAEAGLRGGSRAVTVRDRPVCTGGDIIVAINDHYVANMDQLVSYLVLNTAPGDTVTFLVVRGSQTFEVPVTLRERPTSGVVTPGCGE